MMEFREFVGHDVREQAKVTNRLEQTKFTLRSQTNELDVALTSTNKMQ